MLDLNLTWSDLFQGSLYSLSFKYLLVLYPLERGLLDLDLDLDNI